jgi:hypothetical protein
MGVVILWVVLSVQPIGPQGSVRARAHAQMQILAHGAAQVAAHWIGHRHRQHFACPKPSKVAHNLGIVAG